MRKVMYGLLIVALLFMVIMLGGCDLERGRYISVCDIKSGDIKKLSYEGYFKAIASINERNKTFYTLQRVGEHLVREESDFEGELISSKKIPLVTNDYWMINTFALSDDGNRLVYFDQNIQGISYYNIQSNNSQIIVKNASSTGVSCYALYWLSKSEIVIILSYDEKIGIKDDLIIQFDINTGKKKILYKPTYLASFKYSLSPNRRYFAFFDGFSKHSIYGNIKVLDLNLGKIIATIKGNKNELINSLEWNSSSNVLGFSEGKVIKEYSIKTKQINTLNIAPKNKEKWLYGFINIDTILYAAGEIGGAWDKSTIETYNKKTNKSKKVFRLLINAQTFLVDNGRKFIAQCGY